MLILIRHGQSDWNKKNIFTGWVDVSLSEEGIEEAKRAGKKIKDINIDVCFTSTLIRAQMTLCLALAKSKKTLVFLHDDKKAKEWGKIFCKESRDNILPVFLSWHLNERMYGRLQGFNKDDMRKKYGKEQVHIWRRSFDVAPSHGESLKMTCQRTLPYFKKKILPLIKKGKNVLISAHGNSLRSIIMHLGNLSKEKIVKLEIPTGEPIIYDLKKGKWQIKK